MSEAEEIAKAVQEIAKAYGMTVDVARDFVRSFARILAGPINEMSGVAHDRLRFMRWKQAHELMTKADAILQQRGRNETRPVPPKLALPIIEEGSLEDDPTLRHSWSTLLANAMDPLFNSEIRYGFVDMIKNMTGTDIRILNHIYRYFESRSIGSITELSKHHFEQGEFVRELDISNDACLVSIFNLMRMQCIGPAVIINTKFISPSGPMTIYKGTDSVVLTPLGLLFIEACLR